MTLLDDGEYIANNKDPFMNLSVDECNTIREGSTIKIIVSEVRIAFLLTIYGILMQFVYVVAHRLTVRSNFGSNCNMRRPSSKSWWTRWSKFQFILRSKMSKSKIASEVKSESSALVPFHSDIHIIHHNSFTDSMTKISRIRTWFCQNIWWNPVKFVWQCTINSGIVLVLSTFTKTKPWR